MSLLTTLTRMWVTRSFKSFTFTKHYDTFLSYQECDQLGLYIHIPFCKQICRRCLSGLHRSTYQRNSYDRITVS